MEWRNGYKEDNIVIIKMTVVIIVIKVTITIIVYL